MLHRRELTRHLHRTGTWRFISACRGYEEESLRNKDALTTQLVPKFFGESQGAQFSAVTLQVQDPVLWGMKKQGYRATVVQIFRYPNITIAMPCTSQELRLCCSGGLAHCMPSCPCVCPRPRKLTVFRMGDIAIASCLAGIWTIQRVPWTCMPFLVMSLLRYLASNKVEKLKLPYSLWKNTNLLTSSYIVSAFVPILPSWAILIVHQQRNYPRSVREELLETKLQHLSPSCNPQCARTSVSPLELLLLRSMQEL